MIEKINRLKADEAQSLLADFMEVYFGKGFGVMNKTDIETLMYHVLRKHNLLSGKCFEDSFALQISEAKARKLIYDSQVKYTCFKPEDVDSYLRRSVGEILSRAYLSKNGKEIRFSIEDKYLRVALNAKLRSNNFFADTSFNKDIVSMDENAFSEMINLLVPNFQKDVIIEKLKGLPVKDETKLKEGKEFIKDIAKAIMVNLSDKGLTQLCLYISSLV